MNIIQSSSARSRWRIFPNAFDFIAMLLWVLLSQHIMLGVFLLLGLNTPDGAALRSGDAEMSLMADMDMARMLIVVYTSSMVLAIAGILLYRRLRGGRGRTVRFSLAGLDPTLLLWGFLWMLCTDVVIEPLLELLPPAPNMVGRGFFALAVSAAVAPLCEEIMCRGIILESLRAKYGVVAAWLFSSLFFALLHVQVTAVVNAMVMGSILGYICIRSRSIFSSVLLHSLNNILALTFISFGLGNSTLWSMIPDRRIYFAVYAVSAVVCVVGAVHMVLGLRSERRREKGAQSEGAAQ